MTTPNPVPSRGWEYAERYGGVSKDGVDQLLGGHKVDGLKRLGKDQVKAGQNVAGKIGDAASHFAPTALGKAGVKAASKALPVVGSAYAAYSAYNDFKDGDIVGGLLNVVGVIPGPIGWVGIGLSTAWDHFFGGSSGYGMWDAPDGASTHMLPGAAADENGVADVDAGITAAQRHVFAFTDGPSGSVWNQKPPEELRVDTDEVKAAVKKYLQGVADQFAQIDRTMQASGEPYMQRYRARLQPHFAAMAALPERAKEITDQLTAASDGAGDAYAAVLDANRAARNQLSTNGKLTDQGPATRMKTQLEKASSAIGAANEKLAAVASDSPPAVLTPGAGLPGSNRGKDKGKDGEKQKPATDPKPTTPTTERPATTPHDPKPTTPSMPKVPSMPNLGGGGPRMGGTPGSPLGGTPSLGGNRGGTPLLGDQAKPKSEPKPLVDEKDEKDKKDKPKLSTAADADNRKAAVPGDAATKPGEEAKKAAPQKAAAKPGEKPEAKADGPKEVDVKGTKTEFPDAKTAKMAQLLAGADPAHPMSLADAAAKAGLTPPVPGQDPGQQVSPTDARPGDVLVAGDRQFMVLGDGQFYDLSEYKVVDASALPGDLGDRGGYFRLPDAGDAAAGPVSAPTDDPASFPVPGGTPPAAEPSDASAAPPGAVPGAVPPPAATGPQSVPSQGTPGVPSQGDSGDGPANAEATDTGDVPPVPPTGAAAMDPAAVK